MWNTQKRKRAGESSSSSNASCVFRRHHHQLTHSDTVIVTVFQTSPGWQIEARVLRYCSPAPVRISRLSRHVWEKVELLLACRSVERRPSWFKYAFRHQPTERSLNWDSGRFIYQMRWQLLRLERIFVASCRAEALRACERRANDWIVKERRTTELKKNNRLIHLAFLFKQSTLSLLKRLRNSFELTPLYFWLSLYS